MNAKKHPGTAKKPNKKKKDAVTSKSYAKFEIPEMVVSDKDNTWVIEAKSLKKNFSNEEMQTLTAIPSNIGTSGVLTFINSGRINSSHVRSLKDLTDFPDNVISDWLNTSVKTYRTYKKKGQKLKRDIQERTVLLIALIKHGIEVFGSKENFTEWLEKNNFFFDNKAPASYMDTISGIKFVDDRLTAMEYGDNV